MTWCESHQSLPGARLVLREMTPAFMQASLSGALDLAQQQLGAQLPEVWPDNRELIESRLNQLQSDPDLQPWLLRAICLRDPSVMIGYIGFHTRPDPHYLHQWRRHAVEFGFTIFPGFRRCGYASEAAQVLMRWAHSTQGVNHFVLTIAPANHPSQVLAARLGFKRIGSHEDSVDGEEDVMVLDYTALSATRI